jgi:GLPGLI family protein
MKKKFLIGLSLLTINLPIISQPFIASGKVEYEVKTNFKKTMGTGMWADMMAQYNNSSFNTGYYHLSFANNKSIYQFDHWHETEKMPEFLRKSDEENKWYANFAAGTFTTKKDIWGSAFFIQDSLPKIEWKLLNENRVIAGFNCRKAVGKIMDSVYVFAFYSEEILLPGGPTSINGLPGLILGLTIPRMYTSYIATKITLDAPEANNIQVPQTKKYFTKQQFAKEIKDRIKEWVSENDDEDSKNWLQQFTYRTFL